MRIIVSVGEGVRLVRKYECACFSSIAMAFSDHRFALCQFSPSPMLRFDYHVFVAALPKKLSQVVVVELQCDAM